jgi:hypothetical protein
MGSSWNRAAWRETTPHNDGPIYYNPADFVQPKDGRPVANSVQVKRIDPHTADRRTHERLTTAFCGAVIVFTLIVIAGQFVRHGIHAVLP